MEISYPLSALGKIINLRVLCASSEAGGENIEHAIPVRSPVSK
jgi:hypothetical protein